MSDSIKNPNATDASADVRNSADETGLSAEVGWDATRRFHREISLPCRQGRMHGELCARLEETEPDGYTSLLPATAILAAIQLEAVKREIQLYGINLSLADGITAPTAVYFAGEEIVIEWGTMDARVALYFTRLSWSVVMVAVDDRGAPSSKSHEKPTATTIARALAVLLRSGGR